MLTGEGLQGPKMTTYERCNAAIEEYWEGRSTKERGIASHSNQLHIDQVGGELSTGSSENANKRTNVVLGQGVGFFVPECETAPRDLEEKEKSRTRGIPGYTGTQPPSDRIRPWRPNQEEPEPSRLYAINAFDGRRPRVKGVPGYTGHQPPATTNAPIKNAARSNTQSNEEGPRLFDNGTELTGDKNLAIDRASGQEKEEAFWRKPIGVDFKESFNFPPAEAGIAECSSKLGGSGTEKGNDYSLKTAHKRPESVVDGAASSECVARTADPVEPLGSTDFVGAKRGYPFKLHVGF